MGYDHLECIECKEIKIEHCYLQCKLCYNLLNVCEVCMKPEKNKLNFCLNDILIICDDCIDNYEISDLDNIDDFSNYNIDKIDLDKNIKNVKNTFFSKEVKNKTILFKIKTLEKEIKHLKKLLK